MTSLFAEVPDESPLHSLWRSAISDLRALDRRALDRGMLPSQQAVMIDRVDRAALILRLASGELPDWLPSAPPLERLPGIRPEGIYDTIATPPWSYPADEESAPTAFIESGKHRVVLENFGFHGLEGVAVHSSGDAGVHWQTEKLPYGIRLASWVNPFEKRIWHYIQRDNATVIERIDVYGTIDVFPAASSWRPAQRCRSRVPWRFLDAELMVEGERDYIKIDRHADLVACDDNGALVLSRDALLRCNNSCKRVFSPPANVAGAATLLPDGRWMYVATSEGVAAAWVEEGDGPTFYRLPESTDEVVLLEIVNGHPALLLGWQHNEIIAFPDPPSSTKP